MAFKAFLLVILVAGLVHVIYNVHKLLSPPDLPEVKEVWWGDGEPLAKDESIREFRIDVKQEVIKDLEYRLKNHRIPIPSIKGSHNKYGLNVEVLNEFINFWQNKYNWTERQEFLNKYPQYITNIQGLDIHYIHIKPNSTKSTPLLLLHGWPLSIREFYETIEVLQNNTKSPLELVVPHLPGFVFSDATNKSGLNVIQFAIIFKKLMARLGHARFYGHGTDYGSGTLQTMGVLFPETLLGFHTNFPFIYTYKSYIIPILGLLNPSWVVKPEHYDRVYPLEEKAWFLYRELGYFHLQATKPDTVGVALTDSPVGMAAYFLEKFITGGNFSWIGNPDYDSFKRKFPYTHLLDNFMLYWVSGKVTSTLRIYYETLQGLFWGECVTTLRNPIRVPTVIFRSRYDAYMADGVIPEIFPNLLNLTDHDTGHFPAFESPQEVGKDILRALDIFENYYLKSG